MEKNRGNTGAGGSCLNEGGVRCWGKQSSKDGLVITKQVQKNPSGNSLVCKPII